MPDQIERTLDAIKSQIVIEASKVQQENRWVKAVKDVVKHYNTKIQRVEGHTGKIKDLIRKLFAKKKRYEDMLLQHQLDEEKFKKKASQKEWKELKDATTTSSGSSGKSNLARCSLLIVYVLGSLSDMLKLVMYSVHPSRLMRVRLLRQVPGSTAATG